MTAEHEQKCERTIASVVHEIDDLKHQLADALASIERARDLCHETGRFQYWKAPQWRKPRELAVDILAALETP